MAFPGRRVPGPLRTRSLRSEGHPIDVDHLDHASAFAQLVEDRKPRDAEIDDRSGMMRIGRGSEPRRPCLGIFADALDRLVGEVSQGHRQVEACFVGQ